MPEAPDSFRRTAARSDPPNKYFFSNQGKFRGYFVSLYRYDTLIPEIHLVNLHKVFDNTEYREKGRRGNYSIRRFNITETIPCGARSGRARESFFMVAGPEA
jgi:hypothetical protein